MTESANLTSVAALLSYVQEYSDQLIERAFFTPKTVQMATVHDGVKGKLTLTRIKSAADKAVAWSDSFDPQANAVDFTPRTLEVTAIKRDLSFTPQKFEASYLGQFRKKGQNPGEDLPLEAYILMDLLKTHAQEMEVALWQGEKAGTVTPGTTPMRQTFDGFLEIIKDAITATTIAPFTTPGGAVTQANAVALLESMWDLLPAGYKESEVAVFMSWANFQKYNRGYRDAFGKYVSNNEGDKVKLDFSQNAYLYPMAGMGNSNRIVMTPMSNLHVGFDDIAETSLFNFEQNKRQIDWWMDFKVGVQIAQLDEGIVVNDLT